LATGDRILAVQRRNLAASGRGRLPSLVAANLGRPTLLRLPPREQELATIVHLRGETTAREIEQSFEGELTNSAIRSMLSRLVRKGILKRRQEGNRFVYTPAGTVEIDRHRALVRMSEEYFEGSLYRAGLALLELLDRQQPERVAELLYQFGEASDLRLAEKRA
jgi:predicted transcriptional regulator